MRVPDFTPPSQQQQQQRRGGYGDVTPPPEHRSGHGVTRLDQDKVQGLVAMGFPRLNAEFALLARRNDMGRAIDLLVSMTSSGKCTPRPPPSDPLSSKSRPASSRRSSVWEEVDPFLLYEGQPEEEVKALRHELHQRKCAFSRYVNTLRKQPQ
ncbi:unnamed protein product [Vitrella brassicaformis CCMP3155]|uniref:UBA domain-containing protein n=1 Tax=Vitrella brassicaformis (strain CCMP3155) TaxID=1169540 RepID=A0A0G4FM61_VITBC|nr:unnamed protein product [Vitrella brassicaformis CCMP3155]|eukprot:CEM14924.1 unnamed protein product [Vitrella brassicaformis CCMP3155]